MLTTTVTFQRTDEYKELPPIEAIIPHSGSISERSLLRSASRNVLQNCEDKQLKGVVFNEVDFSEDDEFQVHIEDCRFIQCDFSDAVFRNCKFINCYFTDCNFTSAFLEGCKFDNSRFDDCEFYRSFLNNASFLGCRVYEGSFEGAEISGTVVKGSGLIGPESVQQLINKGRTTFPLSIDFIHQKILHCAESKGLEMHDVHVCDTVHCIAGWAIHLCGEEGYVAEEKLGFDNAAAMIYLASDRNLEKIPDFHGSNESGMKELELLAEKEIAEKGVWDGQF